MKLSRCAGFWTVVLAAVHVAATPVVYRDSARSIVDAGVLGALDADPAQATVRGAAFWYATAGLLLGLVGAGVTAAERRGDGVPRGFAPAMAATGLWGVLLTPVSGFWLFLPIAWLARRNTAAARPAPAAT
ncbi:hypothetical protein H7X46_20700 [Pseudonocardia sp. C8]|uniref:DUF6463 family protein n=1 Tax=Pseudonocardia sp. C8 TaxID=2762759 RepID=UPI0016425F5B|nr:DUF6463 family protein [Pseudonocardia sp. C8]MBC3193485.1 hypothetical protein [Pseudonocardia sp. C8]